MGNFNQILQNNKGKNHIIFNKKDISDYFKVITDFNLLSISYYNEHNQSISPISSKDIFVYFNIKLENFQKEPLKIELINNPKYSRNILYFAFINKKNKLVRTAINYKRNLDKILIIINNDQFFNNFNTEQNKKIKLDFLLGKFLIK